MYPRTYIPIGRTGNVETLDASVYWLSESAQYHVWRRSVAVTSLGVSTKLLYVGPGKYWDGWPSLADKPPKYFTKQPRPTQPPILSGTWNEYQPKCSDALRLGSKGWYLSALEMSHDKSLYKSTDRPTFTLTAHTPTTSVLIVILLHGHWSWEHLHDH